MAYFERQKKYLSLAGGIAGVFAAAAQTGAQPAVPTDAGTSAKAPYNIILIICDQEQYQLLSASGYELPARHRLAEKGTVFSNHYIASAMCSPSRAALLTGTPPQVNGVFDQMEYPFVPTLSPTRLNMGSALKKLGYTTAYFGKFEMDKSIVRATTTKNYSDALQAYGFDYFGANGDAPSTPNAGYENDSYTAGECVSWLRKYQAGSGGPPTKPFFLVTGFVNPHDIMYANANLPGEEVQKGLAHGKLTSPPANEIYDKKWQFTLPASLTESLKAPGMPSALSEYHTGWSESLGYIPTDRADMWQVFNNYYLNLIRDNDSSLQQIVDAMDEMDLWKNTIIIFTADHGEMAGSHGGLRGKGPFAYRENANVPFIIVHPAYAPGKSDVLTSHLDLLPTVVGLTGLPDAQCHAVTQGLPGHDFSSVLGKAGTADIHAVRPGILFNYVGPSTLDVAICTECLTNGATAKLDPLKPHLDKRGFLAFAFDGRYKFARYYAPDAFNTPTTLKEILQYNDVQLFDLQNDPNEMNNLVLDKEKNGETILRMNGLLNELMAKEVGVNDGKFLPKIIRPTGMISFKPSKENAAAAVAK